MTIVSGFVLLAVWKQPVHRAVLGMAWGLILIWIAGGGLAMWHWRQALDRLWAGVRLPWRFKFVAGCTALALLEEAVTTTMTNCAPLFGVRNGQAYITSSANYFDVVLYHSVVVFVPLFIGWAVMLRYWAFDSFAVFLLFGFTGTLCETVSFGPQNLGNLGMWTLVYGLMVWLPARGVPAGGPDPLPVPASDLLSGALAVVDPEAPGHPLSAHRRWITPVLMSSCEVRRRVQELNGLRIWGNSATFGLRSGKHILQARVRPGLPQSNGVSSMLRYQISAPSVWKRSLPLVMLSPRARFTSLPLT